MAIAPTSYQQVDRQHENLGSKLRCVVQFKIRVHLQACRKYIRKQGACIQHEWRDAKRSLCTNRSPKKGTRILLFSEMRLEHSLSSQSLARTIVGAKMSAEDGRASCRAGSL